MTIFMFALWWGLLCTLDNPALFFMFFGLMSHELNKLHHRATHAACDNRPISGDNKKADQQLLDCSSKFWNFKTL